jgi:hypothetical protein
VAVANPVGYHVGRKDKFALLASAVCDARRRFTYWDISMSPNTHDSLAWASCSLAMEIQKGGLESDYFINGDSAYVLSNQMVVPCGKAEFDDFDFEQSSNRIAVEVGPVLWCTALNQPQFHSLPPLYSARPSSLLVRIWDFDPALGYLVAPVRDAPPTACASH